MRISRACSSVRKPSVRSEIQRTGRCSLRAAQATSAYSACTPDFMPNEPPTSAVSTRISVGLMLKLPFAMPLRRLYGDWCAACTTMRPSSPTSAQTPRGSIVLAVTRETVNCSRATCAAVRSAASVASASPRFHRKPMLSGTSSHTFGDAGSNAAIGSVTSGSSR